MSSQYPGAQPPTRLKEGLPVLRKDQNPRANRSSDNMPECVNKWRKPLKAYMTPKEALESFGDKLSNFEREEIKNYPQIYYLGLDAKKIEAVKGAPQNHGFDNKDGVYIKVLKDHIKYRYEILESIGKGAFGQVLKCLDHKTKEQVALKVMTNNPSINDPEEIEKELDILETLRRKDRHNHFNVIHMKEHFVFRGHTCITFELLGMNLHEAYSNIQRQSFSLAKIRRISHDILRCLQLLHQEKIIHCDLKPENIVLAKNGHVKVVDFGCSCYKNETMYSYIQTRPYRAPEIMLRNDYGMEIDMWSLGCIIAELYTGKRLFFGRNEKDQMAIIMEVLGVPPEELIQTACKRKRFFDESGYPRPYTNIKGITRIPGSKDLASVLRSSDPVFVDFVKRCLEWDPKKRMTPDEAMAHDWFQRDPQFCIRSFDPTSQSQAQRNITRGQDNTSASKTQNSTGTRCSPAKDAKMSLRMAAVKTLKLEVTGVTDTERLPRLAVAESPKQEVSKLPWLYIPRPPNNSPERPANPEFKVSRRRPGHRTIIPPSEDVKDLDLCRVFPRLN